MNFIHLFLYGLYDIIECNMYHVDGKLLRQFYKMQIEVTKV